MCPNTLDGRIGGGSESEGIESRSSELNVCKGDTSCKVSLKLTVVETFHGHKLVAVSARKAKVTHKTVVLGTASATIKAGRKATVRIGLNRTGRRLVAARHKVTAKRTVTQRIAGRNRTISTQKVTFKAPRKHVKHGGG